jgi:hypothetical protein
MDQVTGMRCQHAVETLLAVVPAPAKLAEVLLKLRMHTILYAPDEAAGLQLELDQLVQLELFLQQLQQYVQPKQPPLPSPEREEEVEM